MNSPRSAGRLAAVTLLALVAAVLAPQPATAVGTVTTTGTTRTRVALTSTTSLPGLSVTDSTSTDTLQVTLSTDLGTVALSTTTGLTLDYGYSSFSGSTLSFTGLPAAVNTALATASLTSTGTGGTAHVGLSALVSAPGYIYSATNGHFYRFVTSSNISWTQARTDSAASSFNGQPGYLATAPTAATNNVLANRIPNATNAWIAAKSTDTPGSTIKRTWKWDTGPVAGQVISYCSNFPGGCDFTNNTGLYSSWASGEPNNSNASSSAYSGEYVAVTNWQGTQGAWNDITPTSTPISGYIIEYGDLVNGSTGFTGVSTSTSSVLVADAPGVPTGVSATGGDSSATVGFTAPAANGSPITGYTVSATRGGTTTTSACATSPCTVTGLTNGQTYSVTVHATNAVGDSAESSAASAFPSSVPGAPTGVTATRGNGTATVAFTPGVTGGLPVLGYTATSTPGGLTGSCSVSPCTVSGLTNGTAYTFRVAALNSLGSTLSAASNAITPATLPGIPSGVSASTGDGGATLTFTAPAANGAAITGYTVTATPTGGGTPTTTACSASPCTVTGLTNGQTYSYTVHATNAVGDSAESGTASALAATVPGAPTAVSATRGNGSASVAFTPGANGGAPSLGYTATSTPGGLTGTCATSPCTVSGLTNGTSYTFAVTATNSRGSTVSQASNAVTPATVPGVPSAVSASTADGGATVTFTAPAANGSPLTGYTVSATPTGGGTTTTSACSASPCTVSGLTNGTTYTYTVRATNLVGDSGESTASSALAAGLPGAPTSVSATRGNGSATVAFTPGATGGLPVLGYTVTSTPGGLTGSCSVSPCTVTGLANGTSYTFRVAALNSLGSTLSSASNAVTPASLPGRPTLISANHGNGQATLAWTTPSGNGDQVTGYTVTTTTGNLTATRSCTTSPCTVTGLTNGTTYSFVVAAVNAVGTGPVSIGLSTTPATVPDAPGAVTATRGATLVQLSFPRPAFDGGSPLTGYESSLDDQTWAPLVTTGTSTLSATLTGLTNGTQYDVAVRAVNLEGHSLPSTSDHVTPADVPDAPTSITATRGNASAVVSFAAPADHGSPITSYVVTSSGGQSQTCGLSPCTVTGLSNGTAYTFTVRALNDVGTSVASVATGAVTPLAVPGVPTGLVVGSQDSAATLSFVPPAATGGTPLTGFESSVDGGQTWSALTTAGSGTLTGLVTGLTNGTAYVVRVRALNAAGPGPGAASTSVVPAGAPAPVGAPTAVVHGTAATLTWTPPADDGGAPVTSYVVTTVPSSTTCTTSTLTCTLSGLAPGTDYAFVIRADNAHVGQAATGLSPVASTTASILLAVPTSPQALAVAGSDRALRLSFAPPADPGAAPVLGYEASTDDGATWAPLVTTGARILAATIQPVLNGQSYSVRVRALNDLGPGDPTTATPVAVGQWYADPIPARKRATEVAVPARPKAYTGRTRQTVATYRSATGVPVLALISLRNRQLQAGQGVSIRTRLLFVPTRPKATVPTVPGSTTSGRTATIARGSGATTTQPSSSSSAASSLRFTKAGRARLRTLAASLRYVHGLTCEGYSDYAVAGSTALRLSTRRAQAVCRALVGYGAPVVVTSHGYGARRPVVVGPSGVARDTNNRFVVLVTRD